MSTKIININKNILMEAIMAGASTPIAPMNADSSGSTIMITEKKYRPAIKNIKKSEILEFTGIVKTVKSAETGKHTTGLGDVGKTGEQFQKNVENNKDSDSRSWAQINAEERSKYFQSGGIRGLVNKDKVRKEVEDKLNKGQIYV